MKANSGIPIGWILCCSCARCTCNTSIKITNFRKKKIIITILKYESWQSEVLNFETCQCVKVGGETWIGMPGKNHQKLAELQDPSHHEMFR